VNAVRRSLPIPLIPSPGEDGTVETDGRGPATRALGETHCTSLVRPAWRRPRGGLWARGGLGM